MEKPNVSEETPKEEKSVATDEKKQGLENLSKEDLIGLVLETNKESKGRKEKLRENEAELDKYKSKEQKAKDAELLKNGEYQKIIAERDARIAELEPKAQAADDFRNSEIESIKTKLGEQWDEDYLNLSLSSLKKLGEKMTAEIPKVVTDKALGSSKENISIELTEADKAEALLMFADFTMEEAYESYKDLKIHKLKLKKEKET